MENKFVFVATTLFGLEKFVGEEIENLGYKKLKTIDGRVYFEGDVSAFARANINLRCAERIYLSVGSFECDSFESLFENVKALPWENYISKDDSFPVKGHSLKSKLFSIPDIQSIVKKAVVERLKNVYHTSWFEESGVKYQIEFFILNNRADLMIDISGFPLHKRGYRPQSGEAPLRETLAAALVKISRPREDVLFVDPFCGSGTIPIEATLLMTNTPPNLNSNFVCEDFPFVPKEVFENARNEGEINRKLDTLFRAVGSDIDDEVLKKAVSNAERAGMSNFVSFKKMDALELETGGVKGTVVCNPPYGERLSDIKSVEKLYHDMGIAFSKLDRWQIYILTNDEEFERKYGKHADKRKRLYNGMIRCNLYQYFKSKSN